MTEPQKYHCVTQLQEDSWEYRLKSPLEAPNDDDLVSWADYLTRNDQLLTEMHDLDKRRVDEIERVRAMLAAAWRERDEAKAQFDRHVEWASAELAARERIIEIYEGQLAKREGHDQ